MDQVKQRTMLELVKVAKEKGDADAILEIVRYMQPLINKYSKPETGEKSDDSCGGQTNEPKELSDLYRRSVSYF